MVPCEGGRCAVAGSCIGSKSGSFREISNLEMIKKCIRSAPCEFDNMTRYANNVSSCEIISLACEVTGPRGQTIMIARGISHPPATALPCADTMQNATLDVRSLTA